MSMSERFVNCEKVGLEVWPDAEYRCAKVPYSCPMIRAEEVEKILAAGVAITTEDGKSRWSPPATHKAQHFSGYVINIQPIKPKDTAEGLLKEFVAEWDGPKTTYMNKLDAICDRAKALVGRKE